MGIDVECEARWLLRDFDRTPGARALVRHHLGPDAVIEVPGLRTPAELSTVNYKPVIAVKAHLPPRALRWALLHELSEWHLQQLDYREEDVERVAESLTAAIALPRDAYRAAVRRCGPAFEQLSLDFDTAQTCCALRFGEVTGTPTLVGSPSAVRARGEPWGWPQDEGEARRFLRLPALPGLARAQLDGRRRVAVWVEDSAA